MTIYTVDQEASTIQYAPVRSFLIIVYTLIAVFSLVSSVFMFNNNYLGPSLLMAYVLFIMLRAIFTNNKRFAQRQESSTSTEIELGEDYIILRQKHKLDIRIQRGEIKKLEEVKNGLTVLGSNIAHSISIPEYLIGFEEVKAKLSIWAPVQTPSVIDYLKYLPPWFFPALGSFICAAPYPYTRSKWLIAIICLLWMGGAVYSAWLAWKRLDIPPREKLRKIIRYGAAFIIFGSFLIIFIT